MYLYPSTSQCNHLIAVKQLQSHVWHFGGKTCLNGWDQIELTNGSDWMWDLVDMLVGLLLVNTYQRRPKIEDIIETHFVINFTYCHLSA